MAVPYGTPQFLLGSTVRLFCNGMVRLSCIMVRVRYVGTLFEFAYQAFYVQRAAVNEDSCDRARRAHRLGYSHVMNIAS